MLNKPHFDVHLVQYMISFVVRWCKKVITKALVEEAWRLLCFRDWKTLNSVILQLVRTSIKLYMLLFLALLQTVAGTREFYRNRVVKYREKYDLHIRQWKKEKQTGDPILILKWFDAWFPLLKKLPEKCGDCWLTHEKHLEHEVWV